MCYGLTRECLMLIDHSGSMGRDGFHPGKPIGRAFSRLPGAVAQGGNACCNRWASAVYSISPEIGRLSSVLTSMTDGKLGVQLTEGAVRNLSWAEASGDEDPSQALNNIARSWSIQEEIENADYLKLANHFGNIRGKPPRNPDERPRRIIIWIGDEVGDNSDDPKDVIEAIIAARITLLAFNVYGPDEGLAGWEPFVEATGGKMIHNCLERCSDEQDPFEDPVKLEKYVYNHTKATELIKEAAALVHSYRWKKGMYG